MRRWRGTINVPPTTAGLAKAAILSDRLRLPIIYTDHLDRCRRTAQHLYPGVTGVDDGCGPWHMGPEFEGQEITPVSLAKAQFYSSQAQFVAPDGGESFFAWSTRWTEFIDDLDRPSLPTGVVTHNRNIQYLYSRHNGRFYPKLYDVTGPDFLSVHVYQDGYIAPWDGRTMVNCLYLIRHANTSWGT